MAERQRYRVNTPDPNDNFLALRREPRVSATNLITNIPHGALIEAAAGQTGTWISVIYAMPTGETHRGFVNRHYLQPVAPSASPSPPPALTPAASSPTPLSAAPPPSSLPTTEEARNRIVAAALEYHRRVRSGDLSLNDFRRLALQTQHYDLVRQFYDPETQRAIRPLSEEAYNTLRPFSSSGLPARSPDHAAGVPSAYRPLHVVCRR